MINSVEYNADLVILKKFKLVLVYFRQVFYIAAVTKTRQPPNKIEKNLYNHDPQLKVPHGLLLCVIRTENIFKNFPTGKLSVDMKLPSLL